jgi:hypothetical protein
VSDSFSRKQSYVMEGIPQLRSGRSGPYLWVNPRSATTNLPPQYETCTDMLFPPQLELLYRIHVRLPRLLYTASLVAAMVVRRRSPRGRSEAGCPASST